MALKIFKNKGEKNSIPINANNLNYNFTEILNLVYPIGRGFIDFTDTDYSNYLGFTWERELIGMTPIGLDVNDNDFNTIGKTGGSKAMQRHSHISRNYSHNYDAGVTIPASKSYAISYSDIQDGGKWAIATKDIPNSELNEMAETTKTGEGDSGNLQPYQVVAYWKRIA